MSSKDRYLVLAVGILLACSVIGIMVAIASIQIVVGLTQALMVFAGMVSIAAMSSISRFLEGTPAAPHINIAFNEAHTRQVLGKLESSNHENHPQAQASATPWDITADSLLGEDRNLALAKLRIDLEKELRRIAYSKRLSVSADREVGRLLRRLEEERLLDPEIVTALKDVLPACNQAVHGAEVTSETAQAVLSIGEQILRILRSK